MTNSSHGYQNIALAKEMESPENPGGLEKRVALVPSDVGTLVKQGINVFVEKGAGEGVDFSDDDYLENGASLQSASEIYQDKDLIIKFKGPSMESIASMKSGCTLFCMAHFHSYPERAKLLESHRINVIAMEEILESPKIQTDDSILSRTAMTQALHPFYENNSIGALKIYVIGWTNRLVGAIRRAGNRDPRLLKIIQTSTPFEALESTGSDTLYFYDSQTFKDPHRILPQLKSANTHLFDLVDFEGTHGKQAIDEYRKSHPSHDFGMRRIQCLHETGQAGARYGLKLLKANKPDLDLSQAKAVVLGYGNVGQGAIHEIYDHGIKQVSVLGRTHTTKGRIDYWLKGVDLVVNGAEQAPQLRGINYLVTNKHLEKLIPDGSVVIDLVGGSESNRSPVEPVLNCTFLTEPHFVQSGVTVSALWGWPMMGMMRETAIRYSGQILDVLQGPERLLNGIPVLTPGVKRALVCGPF